MEFHDEVLYSGKRLVEKLKEWNAAVAAGSSSVSRLKAAYCRMARPLSLVQLCRGLRGSVPSPDMTSSLVRAASDLRERLGVEMTAPSHPRSSSQAYRLTAVGRKIVLRLYHSD